MTHGTRRYKQYNPVKLQQEVHDAVQALMALNSKTMKLEDAESLANAALQVN